MRLRSEDMAQNIINGISPAAILFFASKKNSPRVPSWHPADSDSGLLKADESTKKVHNDAIACFSWKWSFGIWTASFYILMIIAVTLRFLPKETTLKYQCRCHSFFQ